MQQDNLLSELIMYSVIVPMAYNRCLDLPKPLLTRKKLAHAIYEILYMDIFINSMGHAYDPIHASTIDS